MKQAYLEFNTISKSFPGVIALDTISLSVQEGSIHGIVGENGAGKSTLLKILSGVYAPGSGSIHMNGIPQSFHTEKDAIRAGIAVIYQELHLAPELSVSENLLMGNVPNRFGVVNRKELRNSAAKALESLGEDIHPSVKTGSLPIAKRQMIEIAKALIRNAKVIAFDEPTSSFTDREVKKLFDIIRDLKNRGHVILYVSHRLNEIFELCDTVTILRDGVIVETCENMTEINHDHLVRSMVGRPIEDIYHYTTRRHGSPALEIEGLTCPGIPEKLNLSVSQGEIVGLFGLVGAGRTELLKTVYGAEKPLSGTIRIHGKEVAIKGTASAIGHGLVYCPEDRKNEGVIAALSVKDNINLSVRRTLSHYGIIDKKGEKANAQKFIEKLSIKTPSPNQLMGNLSGGNQQKVILARWLSEKVKVMLLDEPTRGIDIGAKSEIYALISQLASDGIGIIAVSSELTEILGISDRIIVMREGKITASLRREEATEETVLRHALPVV